MGTRRWGIARLVRSPLHSRTARAEERQARAHGTAPGLVAALRELAIAWSVQ